MENIDKLQLLSDEEATLRLNKVRTEMRKSEVGAILISDNANIFYLTGRVFTGYIYISSKETPVRFYVRRPVGLTGDNISYIRKIEDIPALLATQSEPVPEVVGIEMDTTSYSDCSRMLKALAVSRPVNANAVMRAARSVKTPLQIQLAAESGIKHESVYRKIPSVYRPGMTDVELQIEIEYLSRKAGCLGQFRISGQSMEIFMGNILAGDNADTPTPYDFAMGGGGQHPSLPVGADGTVIRPGMSVMVDCNGNFTGYMTDMTRVFAPSPLPDEALAAHECSRAICRRIAEIGKPGTEAKTLYEEARSIAREAGFEKYFMGHRQQAGFIGHGVGIEINESPVIAPRSRDILTEGNIIALEPKFVIPGVGAVGIENTYVVENNKPMRCLTNAPEEIIIFEHK